LLSVARQRLLLLLTSLLLPLLLLPAVGRSA